MKALAKFFATMTAPLRDKHAALTWHKQCWPCADHCQTPGENNCYAIWVGKHQDTVMAMVDHSDAGDQRYSWYCDEQSGHARSLAQAQAFAQNALPAGTAWWRPAGRKTADLARRAFTLHASDISDVWTRTDANDRNKTK